MRMDTLPDPATMDDKALLREWECVDCDAEDDARTVALAAELQKRNLDF